MQAWRRCALIYAIPYVGFPATFRYCADSNRELLYLIAHIWIFIHWRIANCAGLASGRSHIGFVALSWLDVSDFPPNLRRVVDGRLDFPVLRISLHLLMLFLHFCACFCFRFPCSIFRSVVKCMGDASAVYCAPPPAHPHFTTLTFAKAWSATRNSRCGRCLFAPPSKGGASLLLYNSMSIFK